MIKSNGDVLNVCKIDRRGWLIQQLTRHKQTVQHVVMSILPYLVHIFHTALAVVGIDPHIGEVSSVRVLMVFAAGINGHVLVVSGFVCGSSHLSRVAVIQNHVYRPCATIGDVAQELGHAVHLVLIRLSNTQITTISISSTLDLLICLIILEYDLIVVIVMWANSNCVVDCM